MSQASSALLALVRGGLWGNAPEHDKLCHLDADAWQQTLDMARRQTVTAVAFDGLCLLPDGLMPPMGIVAQWAAEAEAVGRRNQTMDMALDSLCHSLATAGVRPVLQKGQAAARHYAHPASRECGDIDLYIATKQAWYAASNHLRRQGIALRREPDGALFYKWSGVGVEHHQRLLDAHSPRGRRTARRMEQADGFDSMPLAGGSTVCVPSARCELMLQYLHILKHALGRGVGLRQLCDMACACADLSSQCNATQLRNDCRRMGLLRWCALLHTFLTERLGLPVSCLPFADTAPSPQPLDDIVWRGGNFGQHDQSINSAATPLARKMATARSFARNARFAMTYAPAEAAWAFARLMAGQLLH